MSEDNLSGAPEAKPEDQHRDEVRPDAADAHGAADPVESPAERDQISLAESADTGSTEPVHVGSTGESPVVGVESPAAPAFEPAADAPIEVPVEEASREAAPTEGPADSAPQSSLDGVEYGEASLNSLDEGRRLAHAAEAYAAESFAPVALAEGAEGEAHDGELVAVGADLLPEERQRSTLSEWTITILLLLFLTTTLVQAYVIPTGSMEDTLLIGDHLLVDKLAYAPPGPVSQWILPYTDVKRGDIIVFRYPVDIAQTFVKRAIGVPGDRIRIINKEVYLNGVKVNEPYSYHKTPYIDSYRDNFPGEPNGPIEAPAYDMLANDVVNGEVVVPANSYFALGDNRDSSLDSRFWGFVPRENIIGKPLIIYWSYDAPTEDLNTSSISLKHMIDLAKNFFTKTRWNRTFQLIHGYPLE